MVHAKSLLVQYKATQRSENDSIKRQSNIIFPIEGKHLDENDSLKKAM